MAKATRIEATELPEEVIQHIQSFLIVKRAAKTSILSKSWYAAWLTRPDLDFALPRHSDITSFLELGENTVRRYVELNLKIQSFKLFIDSPNMVPLVEEWTRKAAAKLGATHIDINDNGFFSRFVLPHEVLQSESLLRLSFAGGRIHNQSISCGRLKSLDLRRVRLEGNIILDLISMCPLIEELLLSHCECVYVNNYSGLSYVKMLKLMGDSMNDLHKLKVLSMEFLEIGECFFHDLSSKFPCLEELTLKSMICIGYDDIQICSNSLQRIVLFHWPKLRVKFDVPQIRRLEYNCCDVPSISFGTTSSEWEFDISFWGYMHYSSCFMKFRQLMMELISSSAKVSLHLSINHYTASLEDARHIMDLPAPPVVEKLELLMEASISAQSAIVNHIFWSCRPKFIIIPHTPRGVENCNVVKLICKRLIEEDCGVLHHLEEVNVEASGSTLWTWRPLPSWAVYASPFFDWTNETKICLQLKWG